MSGKRKRHSAEFKAKVARDALREQKTLNELAGKYGIHSTQVAAWKKQALEGLAVTFAPGHGRGAQSDEALRDRLYQQIGQLKVELDWLKKSLDYSIEARRAILDWEDAPLAVSRQCALLGLSRSTGYYTPAPANTQDLLLMRLMDEQYTATPFYGVRRLAWRLGELGHPVGLKRVRRLMRTMGLVAIYPKPRLSQPAPGHTIYPYLLRGLAVTRPNQVWCADITYVRLSRGFIYLAAVMDWFSRCVLAWRLSNTLDALFCVEALEESLGLAAPEIFNTDQGSQFTSALFTGRLREANVRISMDGRGRALDNVFIERLWRSVKYEEVYLRDYRDMADAHGHLTAYFHFYNHQRPHQALGYATPAAVHHANA
jgi:putative transposase